jgi:hypothetical protein
VTSSHGPLFTKPRRRFIRLWAALALLNLAAGIVLALQPERWTDLDSIMRWGHDWLVDGTNVYTEAGTFVDYPPQAVVLLSPLGVLPSAVALPFWVMANLAFVFLAPYFAARFFQPHAPFRTILLPILMFASWWGAHTLVQFSLLALVLSMATLMYADRSAAASGVCLGLALMKPQVAVPVFLWTLFTRQWKIAAIASGVVAGGVAIFCARAHANPWELASRYLAILAMYHTGDAILTGASELRPLIHLVVADLPHVDGVAAAVALGLLAGICVAGFQEGRSHRRLLYAAPPLAACWSLLTFYHLSYGFVVLLPALMILLFNDAEHTPLRKGVFWLLQIGMMLDAPGIMRRSGFSLPHADRILILLIFSGLLALAWRESAPPEVRA